MLCPYCGSNQVFVVNSRPTRHNSQTWRRKRCRTCKEIFTTYEKVDLSYLKVIKKSGKKQRYSRAKLFSGIYNSAIYSKNTDKGELGELAEALTNEIERKIIQLKKKSVETTEITNIVLSVLQGKSPDIFLKYLAYREGKDRKKMKKLIDRYLK